MSTPDPSSATAAIFKVVSEGIARNTPAKPFRFLDLPPELRCMVYDCIHITTTKHVLTKTDAELPPNIWPKSEGRASLPITLIRKSIPAAILATCRLINQEATPLLAPRLEELQREPLRFFVDFAAATALTHMDSPLRACFPELSYCRPTVSAANNAVRIFSARSRKFLRHTVHEARFGPLSATNHVDVEFIFSWANDEAPHIRDERAACMGICEVSVECRLATIVVYQDWLISHSYWRVLETLERTLQAAVSRYQLPHFPSIQHTRPYVGIVKLDPAAWIEHMHRLNDN